ncbi:MAG: chromosomal replication initiator protein DnaA [Brevinematales bacterium]|nr:chromosomal replication initiator protein DnaA [Brevinematales bacterium]
MDTFLKVWEEFVNIVTLENQLDKVILSKVKTYCKDGKFFICVGDEFTRTWIEKNYFDRIVSTFKYYDVDVEIIVSPDSEDDSSIKKSQKNFRSTNSKKFQNIEDVDLEKVNGNVVVVEKEEVEVAIPDINPRYTFDRFIVGSGNDFAYHSALNVSKYPGMSYNPLFMYGGVGLGKTHLLHAIANEISRTKKSKRVLYVTSEQFTNEFFKALSSKNLHSFRLRYREADVLLLDDVQFFKSSMKQAIEELFHTFNKLSHDKKQMVFTSDRTPKELDEIGDRMISRFEGGLVVEIKPPDFETRLKIVEKKFEEEGVDIDVSIKEFIANSIQSNIRSLESAVNKVCAFLSFKSGRVDLGTVKVLIKDLLEVNVKSKEFNEVVYTIDDILKSVANYYNTTVSDLLGEGRKDELVFARQVVMYLAKRLTNLTFSEIAEKFGKVHSTAVRAYERIDALIKRDFLVKEQIKEVLAKIKKIKSGL